MNSPSLLMDVLSLSFGIRSVHLIHGMGYVLYCSGLDSAFLISCRVSIFLIWLVIRLPLWSGSSVFSICFSVCFASLVLLASVMMA